ncbi:retrovirus-related Pol polyprotein from transposon 17.6 [Trichonephila clavipes]|nr:retrovirus-related Pol polyprotein from transposon 17.6 [Trichonephila clavipes]
MLKLGIIEVGESDYMSPMILVEVAGKEPRPCIDYRKLNGIIRTEYFSLPNIEECVEKESAAKFITVLIVSKGYWQIQLSKTAQRDAAFCTSFGTYRPLRMSFGLKNAPYFFSKLMAELLNGLEDFVVPYLDDIAVFSDTWESHIKHMETVLQRIKRAKLTIKPSKCKFAQQNVKFLGHIVGQGFRTPSEIKVQAVLEFPTPRTKTQIRAFFGLAGYYQKYINLFSVIAAPLTDVLKGRAKKGEIKWTTEGEDAFREQKGKQTDKPVLYAPNFEREFIVQTDASNAGMGAVLTQLTEQGEEHPILYLIMTDHNPLVWLNRNVSSNSRLMRWALALQPYNFRIVHRSAGYYQKYINLFSVIAAPLTDVLKGRAKKGEIKWTTEGEDAFREQKGKQTDKPVLYAPNFEREFIVQTDASNAGMGAVLTQLTEQGEEHPILYLIMTDHNPLVWLNRNVSSNSRLMRWALALQPYNFRIVHRSGIEVCFEDSLKYISIECNSLLPTYKLDSTVDSVENSQQDLGNAICTNDKAMVSLKLSKEDNGNIGVKIGCAKIVQ